MSNLTGSISRRKIATTDDILKILADQIRDQRSSGKGVDSNRGYTLNLFPIIPDLFFLSDTLSFVSTNQIDESITVSDTVLSFSQVNSGTYVIGTAQIGYSDVG